MYHPFFVCVWLKNSIFGEFSNIYLLSAQNRVKWRHKIRPIAKKSGRFWFSLHETTPNWCPERCAKFHVDTVVNEEVIPEKPRGGRIRPPPRRWRVKHYAGWPSAFSAIHQLIAIFGLRANTSQIADLEKVYTVVAPDDLWKPSVYLHVTVIHVRILSLAKTAMLAS